MPWVQNIRKVSDFDPKHLKVFIFLQNIRKVSTLFANYSKGILSVHNSFENIELVSQSSEKYLIQAQYIRKVLNFNSKHLNVLILKQPHLTKLDGTRVLRVM